MWKVAIVYIVKNITTGYYTNLTEEEANLLATDLKGRFIKYKDLKFRIDLIAL